MSRRTGNNYSGARWAFASRPPARGEVVCILCGRRGTRGFVLVSGTGDGTRDSYQCAERNRRACERRQHLHPLPEIGDSGE